MRRHRDSRNDGILLPGCCHEQQQRGGVAHHLQQIGGSSYSIAHEPPWLSAYGVLFGHSHVALVGSLIHSGDQMVISCDAGDGKAVLVNVVLRPLVVVLAPASLDDLNAILELQRGYDWSPITYWSLDQLRDHVGTVIIKMVYDWSKTKAGAKWIAKHATHINVAVKLGFWSINMGKTLGNYLTFALVHGQRSIVTLSAAPKSRGQLITAILPAPVLRALHSFQGRIVVPTKVPAKWANTATFLSAPTTCGGPPTTEPPSSTQYFLSFNVVKYASQCPYPPGGSLSASTSDCSSTSQYFPCDGSCPSTWRCGAAHLNGASIDILNGGNGSNVYDWYQCGVNYYLFDGSHQSEFDHTRDDRFV